MEVIRNKALVVLVALVALAALAAAMLPATGAAHAGGVPAHEVGAFNCGAGLVHAYPPRQMLSSFATDFRNPEMVYWTPVLFRYDDARGWQQVTWPGRWYRAFTSSYGYYQAPFTGAWTDTVSNAGMRFVPFSGLARGWYAVVNWIAWTAPSRTHAEPSTVCYVS